MDTSAHIMDHISLRQIDYGSMDYDRVIDLRYRILRKPLQLHFSAQQLAAEKDDFHLACFYQNELIACLLLVAEPENRMRMKQVAVESDWQGKGIGKLLVLFAEEFAGKMGFVEMYCHARDTAIEFYRHLGYKTRGEIFEEVTIPHQEMYKALEESH